MKKAICPKCQITSYKTARYSIEIGCCEVQYYDDVVVGLQLYNGGASQGDDEKCEFSDRVAVQLNQYLAGERKTFDLKIGISTLTPFQQKVLHELQQIPYGETRTYKEVAKAIGNPKAARAVGSACNRNPILLIIPCHRVVGANGALTGYAAGVELKNKLLNIELKL